MTNYVEGKSYISKDKSYKFKVNKVINGFVYIEADDGSYKVELSDLELLNPTEIKESVNSNTMNGILSNIFRVNGPSSRGARMPDPIASCVNVGNFDDKLRFKEYNTEYDYSDDSVTFNIDWVTQEPFTDASKLIAEFVRWAKVVKGLYRLLRDKKFIVKGTITCRDGKSEGFQKFKEIV